MSDKALTTFERGFEDWRIKHPRQWIPVTNREAAAEFISKQANKIVNAQLEAADRIIVSQDRIASGIDKVAISVDMVSSGLEGLASLFDWGFSEIVWQLEQQNTVLEKILKVLQAPLDTQAKELKKRAEEAYRNGWYDDAIQDFLESEKKNRYDFTIHQSLGNIYFEQKRDPERALEYYEKAAKYALPKSSYHVSRAMLGIGLIKYLQEDFKKSYEATSKAIELSPNLYEAHYDCARYCANLGKYDEAIDHLEKAVKGDRYYCLKADLEKDFDVMKKRLKSFFEDLRNEAQNQAKEEIDKAKELIAYAKSCGLSTSGKSEKFGIAVASYGTASKFLKSASLFDFWDATYKAWDAQELAIDALEGYVSDQISRASKENTTAIANLEERKDWWTVGLPRVVLAGIHILCYIGVAIGMFIEKDITSGIVWLIFAPFVLLIAFVINAFVFVGLIKLIGWPVFYFLCKGKKTRYESRLAELHSKLSEIQSKRSELNWQYEQKGN